jgi:hypothetical protein
MLKRSRGWALQLDHEKRRRAVRNGDIGALELEHALCVLVKERNIAVSASRSWIKKSGSGRLDTAGTGGIQIEHALCVRVGW